MRKIRNNTKIENSKEPKKSLGQNFLRDEKILQKIVNFAQIKKEDVVVEVGPGEGTLTSLLLKQASRVIAIEKDESLALLLQTKFEREITDNRLQIIVADALNYNLPSIDYKLVGNIPYYITGALFKKVLESENPPSSITFVVQKEVAERIVAKNKKESILSISVKAYGTPEYGGTIKAGSFYPVPKVDSAIIAVRNISKKRFEDLTPTSQARSAPPLEKGRGKGRGFPETKFFEILKLGFAHKRKLLIKNLGVSPAIFEKCGLHEKSRAEDLKVEDWFCLAKELL